jgi:hypothetical protein
MYPYELKQRKYHFWKEVGERFGPLAQATIFAGLCHKNHKVYVDSNIRFALESIKSLAAEHEVMLIFLD